MVIRWRFPQYFLVSGASFWGLLYSQWVFLVPFGERCEDVALTKLRELFYEKLLLFFNTLMMETALRSWSNRDRFPNAVHDKNRLRIISLILVIYNVIYWLYGYFTLDVRLWLLDALHSAAAASGAGHRWCGLVRQQWSRRRGSENMPRPLVRPCSSKWCVRVPNRGNESKWWSYIEISHDIPWYPIHDWFILL